VGLNGWARHKKMYLLEIYRIVLQLKNAKATYQRKTSGIKTVETY